LIDRILKGAYKYVSALIDDIVIHSIIHILCVL